MFKHGDGDVTHLVERRTSTPLGQVRFPGAARDCSPRANFQCRLSYGVRAPPCATACVNICAHVKDPVVYVRFRWIMDSLKHPACAVGWVARLCRSWLPAGPSGPQAGLVQRYVRRWCCMRHLRSARHLRSTGSVKRFADLPLGRSLDWSLRQLISWSN